MLYTEAASRPAGSCGTRGALPPDHYETQRIPVCRTYAPTIPGAAFYTCGPGTLSTHALVGDHTYLCLSPVTLLALGVMAAPLRFEA